MAEVGTNAAGELIWRCDRCQRVFETEWDEADGSLNMPALMTTDTGDWCDARFLAECPDGVYEPD